MKISILVLNYNLNNREIVFVFVFVGLNYVLYEIFYYFRDRYMLNLVKILYYKKVILLIFKYLYSGNIYIDADKNF